MPDVTARFAIRPARHDDVAAVVACLAAAFEPFRERYTPDAFRDTVVTGEEAERRFREMTVLVAEDGSARIVGTIAHQVVAEGEGHLRGMAVVPDLQGSGLAERLLSAAEAALRSAGCTRVTLDTTLPLARAIRFYERRGYRRTGVVRDFFGMPLHEYAKDLGGAAG